MRACESPVSSAQEWPAMSRTGVPDTVHRAGLKQLGWYREQTSSHWDGSLFFIIADSFFEVITHAGYEIYQRTC